MDAGEWSKLHKFRRKNTLGNLLMEVRDSITTATGPSCLFDSLLQRNNMDALPTPFPTSFPTPTPTPTPIPTLPDMRAYMQDQMGSQTSLDTKSTTTGSTTSLPVAAVGSAQDLEDPHTEQRAEQLQMGQASVSEVTGNEQAPASGSAMDTDRPKDNGKREREVKATVDGSHHQSSTSMDIEEADATSFSFDSDLLRSSFSAKSVTTDDGYLDCD